ncbi:hypothetical protein CEXT_157791 [Caerostris extrusa]|uniref:Uncharacterized protein n=1 Tax=Caerostris extrusa TaxID=172846 RepID=A0AAV4XVI9_CAEEX|nr:hypothetical protein CEXT_157791 [Caerostris extrusa]
MLIHYSSRINSSHTPLISCKCLMTRSTPSQNTFLIQVHSVSQLYARSMSANSTWMRNWPTWHHFMNMDSSSFYEFYSTIVATEIQMMISSLNDLQSIFHRKQITIGRKRYRLCNST